ncbi:hypothetical protein MMC16_003823 [Acarospora aff. strigata]|nr:hypothetical protein [Acarospora aff. strigata]
MENTSDLALQSPGEKPVPRPKTQLLNWTRNSQQCLGPGESLHTESQRRMWAALSSKYAGHFALAQEIYTIASTHCQKGNAHVSWDWLVEDRRSEQFSVYLQLISLPTILLKSLIKNTLPYDYLHSDEVRSAVDRYMRVTNHPGVYCQALATRGKIAGGTPSSDAGKGWSRDQVEQLCKDIDLYLDRSPEGDKWGLEVDNVIRSGIQNYKEPAEDLNNRRYCLNSRREEQRRTLTAWKDLLRSQQSFSVSSHFNGAEHSVRSRMEVGWSVDQESRLKDHENNGQTTQLWGIGQALSRLNWPAQFSSPHQWSLFRVWAQDVRLAQLSEHLGSMLCSAYAWDGGFNCTEAGNVAFKGGSIAHSNSHSWDINGREVFENRKCTKHNWEKDLQELKRKSRALQDLPNKRQKTEEVERLQPVEAAALEEYWEYRTEKEQLDMQIVGTRARIAEMQKPAPVSEKLESVLARVRRHLAKSNEPVMPASMRLGYISLPGRDPSPEAPLWETSPQKSEQALEDKEGYHLTYDDFTNITSPGSIPSSSPFVPSQNRSSQEF